jgi:adenylylsulfate kinase-like enzyme
MQIAAVAGLSGAAKSTIADAVGRQLHAADHPQ